MWVRHLFFYLQFAAVVLLPGWVVVARALAPAPLGSIDVLVFASWPLLAVALLGVVGITWARRAVRSSRTVSWLDVGVLSTWYATGVLYGILIAGSSVTAVGLVAGLLSLVSIAAFWASIWQLAQAAKRRVERVLAGFDRRAVSVGEYSVSEHLGGDRSAGPDRVARPRIIRLAPPAPATKR